MWSMTLRSPQWANLKLRVNYFARELALVLPMVSCNFALEPVLDHSTHSKLQTLKILRRCDLVGAPTSVMGFRGSRPRFFKV